MSIIKLYKTSLSPNRNFLIEDFSTWLSSKATTLYSYNSGQFIKQDMTLTLKVPLDEFSVNKLNVNFVDYVSIKNIEEGTTTSTFYYYVVHSVWRGKTTIELTLVLDVLNTYKIGTDYSLSPRSFIKREHKDRFVKDSNKYVINNIIVKPHDSSPIYINKPLPQVALRGYSDNVKGKMLNAGDIAYSFNFSIKYYDNGAPYLEIEFRQLNGNYNVNRELEVIVYYDNIVRKIDLYSEEISAPVYSSEYYEIEDSKIAGSWYLYYKNRDDIDESKWNQKNPVECYLLPEEKININYITDIDDNIIDLSSLSDGYYLIGGGIYSFIIGVVGMGDISLQPTKDEEIVLEKHSGHVNIYLCGGDYSLGVRKSYKDVSTMKLTTEISSVSCGYSASHNPIDDLQLFFENAEGEVLLFGGTNSQHLVISSIYIDRVLAENIKLIKLPYCPTTYKLDSHNNVIFSSCWEFDSSVEALKLTDLNQKFYNLLLSDYNPLENILMTLPAISEDDLRNDDFESKLFHSDYYKPHFYYDSFNFDFELERVDTEKYLNSISDKFQIEFITSRNIVSKFLFKFPQYQLSHSLSDYDNIVCVARNNEEVLYNSQYINYIRTGFNYDVKSKERNESMSWASLGISTAGSIGSLALGAVTRNPFLVAQGVVGLAASFSNSIISIVKTSAQSEANIQQKLLEAKRQAVSVNNADDIDLLSYYSNNKARFKTYHVSNKIKEQLAENKVVILENKKEELKINESSINLIGIDDPRMAHESFISDSEIVKVELDNTKYNGDKYNILLSHRPELFDTYVEKKIDLILTGHAHGGQIRIPFIGGIVAPNQGFFPKYTSGVIEKNKTTMVVSRGIGNSIIPLRINNRPELVVITLYNK